MRAIFLDRDGVINENRAQHVREWREFAFVPGALAALQRLHAAGLPVFVVTNQAIVGRGVVSAAAVEEIHARMLAQVALHGGNIHDVRYCPHDPAVSCGCRKPAPGMLLELAVRWRVDLRRSYMVGDAWTDIAAGRAVGCRCVLVRTGRGAEQLLLPELHQHPADMVAADLSGAVDWILGCEGLSSPGRPDNHAWRGRLTASSRLTAPIEGR
ncbi:MAG TPA: HAD family hydrolase [Roseiflexaceae bacterium]|nr:HAD family hydrolase [Roseiflexaceae bacterium]